MKLTDNDYLREQIFKRMNEIGWKDTDLIKDAAERDKIIEPTRWTKYKKNKSGQITDETLIWIATRLGIDIIIRFGEPVFDGKNITWQIPKYDELKIIKRLKELYPKNK